MKIYPFLKKIWKNLSDIISIISPKKLPDIYTCITGFNNSMITMQDSIIGISLDGIWAGIQNIQNAQCVQVPDNQDEFLQYSTGLHVCLGKNYGI